MFMTEEEAIEYYNESPAWLKKLCQAFADGINFYLHTHPEVEPDLLTRFEPWMPMYFTEGSIGGDIESVSTRKIKAFYEGEEATSELPFEKSQGSNGIAISGKLTESGNAMLLINPHTTFYFRGEVHVVSGEGLNAYGAVTWGQFFVYQGFNEKNGWMHTSSYTDVMDNFVETIVTRDGKKFYKYADELRPIIEKQIALSYKSGDSTLQRTFPVYKTHHGPITHTEEGNWTSTAMMWSPVKEIIHSYTRTKTSN
jgi:acyl-homoserine lactone acylase PvdQ